MGTSRGPVDKAAAVENLARLGVDIPFVIGVDTDGWLVGLTPHLWYNFASGTRWIPFVDGGAGITATGIGRPDLSGTFEFDLQPGLVVHWFILHSLALTSEVRYMHMSCAGINHPNLGVNNVVGMVGLTWYFGK